MANLLTQPTLWENDGGNSPPSYWDGAQYVLESPPGTGTSFAIHSYDSPSGSTVSGCITQTNDNGENLYLILGHTGDSEWYGPFDSIALPHGRKVEFNFSVPSAFRDRLTLLVGMDPNYMYASYAYGQSVHIDPGCLDLVAVDDSATTRSGTPVTTNVLANDTLSGKPVTLAQLSGIPVITVQPKNGTVTVNADGTITYRPNPGFSGEDSYEYGIQLPEAEVCAHLDFSSGSGNTELIYPQDFSDLPSWFSATENEIITVDFGHDVVTRYQRDSYGNWYRYDGEEVFYGPANGSGTLTQGENSVCLNWSVHAGS